MLIAKDVEIYEWQVASSRDSVAPHSPKRVSPFSIVEAFYLGATKSPARMSKEPRARYRNRARPLLSRAAMPPGRLELPTYGLENRCSIRLSYEGHSRGLEDLNQAD